MEKSCEPENRQGRRKRQEFGGANRKAEIERDEYSLLCYFREALEHHPVLLSPRIPLLVPCTLEVKLLARYERPEVIADKLNGRLDTYPRFRVGGANLCESR